MRSRKTVLLFASMAAALVLACTAALVYVLMGQPPAASTCEPSSWKIVSSEARLDNPRAIAPIAGNDIWIVGGKRTSGSQVGTGAEHWDGNSWTLVPTPNRKTGKVLENGLNGADAVSSDYVWAVGYYLSKGAYRTLVERWNGTEWKLVESPNVGSDTNTLTGVDALGPSRAWAVGYYREGNHRKTLILHWNGASWRVVSSPNPGPLSNALLGVSAASGDDIWAVGYMSGNKGHRSLILHYDGTAWRRVGVPKFGSGDNVLTSVSSASSDEVWAAGYYIDGTRHKTLTLHYDGGAWERVPSANGGDGVTILRDIDAVSSADAWAVGSEYRAAPNNFVASSQHWGGSSWSALQNVVARSGRESEMRAVAKAPGNSRRVWAAGPPANVESLICSSGSNTAEAAIQEETSAAPTDGSVQAAEQPSSVSAEPSVLSAQVATASGGISVMAADKADDAGIYEVTKTYGAVVDDFDNDQLPDIFLGRHGDAARLYVNDGNGHFTETDQGRFSGGVDRHGCDAADVNQDRLKDIFCVTGAVRGAGMKKNELYIQQPDHTFVDRADRYGVLDPFGRGRSGAFIDANGDNLPDLFAANESGRGDGMPSPNRLFLNRGGNAYRYAPWFGLEIDSDGGNIAVGDINRDGWQDLLVATYPNNPFALSRPHIYRNDEGNGFTDVAKSVGLGQKVIDATLANVNGDAWPDVIAVTRDELQVLLNEQGTFSLAFSTTVSDGLSVAAGDVNGDNRQDIYVLRGKSTTSANAPDQVYLNDGTGRNFTQMTIPSTSEGSAESVWPIDYDKNGLTDFLVLNGLGDPGPVQLIAFLPASS